MGIGTPDPVAWLGPVSFTQHSGAARRNGERELSRAKALPRPNTELVAMLIKTQEENHG
jgi:hypothetical protein